MIKRERIVMLYAVILIVLLALTGCGGSLQDIADINSDTRTDIISDEELQPDVQESETVWQTGEHDERYVYMTLDEECQRVYTEIYATIINHEEAREVSTLDPDVLDEAYRAVMSDYGELFWFSGYVYTQYKKGDVIEALEFAPSYTKTADERSAIQEQIDGRVSEILADISPDASDYDKTRYVFDYLAANVDYVLGSQDNQNIISVFLYGQTVCQGYASATQYLLSKLGIQSAIVTGEAEGNAHAWNLVRMDGEYYYVDTTWGNSTYTGEEMGNERFINYNYFGITTDELLATHLPDDAFALPECTATRDNYYMREECYFSTWEPDTIGALCKAGYESGNTAVSVKFATEELYQQTKQYFIEEQHILDYCSGITTLYYVEDVQQKVLIFRF